MAEAYTDITMVVDKSSSMANQVSSTIEGFNTFLHQQKEAEGKATITLIQFGSDIQTDYEGLDVQDAPELSEGFYVPNGMTALNDAVGSAILQAQKRHRAMAEAERPHKVVVVVLTDGQENQSKEFAGPQGLHNLKTLIERQQTEGWEFVFLGQDLDAQAVAQTYAIPQGQALSYRGSSRGIEHAYVATSHAIADSRMALNDVVRAHDGDDLLFMEQAREVSVAFRDEDLVKNDEIVNGEADAAPSATTSSSGT